MQLTRFVNNAITPALGLLPAKMRSTRAITLLLAIALQESRVKYRQQIGGPARGYFMFEKHGGVAGVLQHAATAKHASAVCEALDYPADVGVVYTAIEHNDILAAAFARLLLWTLPQPLAKTQDEGWAQYTAAWRPGKPHPDRWTSNWVRAVTFAQNTPWPFE